MAVEPIAELVKSTDPLIHDFFRGARGRLAEDNHQKEEGNGN